MMSIKLMPPDEEPIYLILVNQAPVRKLEGQSLDQSFPQWVTGHIILTDQDKQSGQIHNRLQKLKNKKIPEELKNNKIWATIEKIRDLERDMSPRIIVKFFAELRN